VKATDFEYRHSVLIHRVIIAVAFLTYLVDPDDIVWWCIKGHTAHRKLLERALFGLATVLVGIASGLSTRARARPQTYLAKANSGLRASERGSQSQYAGDFLYAIGLGSLAPLWGFIILVTGEAIRIFRLTRRANEHSYSELSERNPRDVSEAVWWEAFRREVFKWGIFLTMVVFTITLRDRVAEVLAVAVCLVGLLLTLPFFDSSGGIAPT